MKIIVLGSGVIGTTSAYYLQKAGHEVTVIDRGAHSATETSFANGGQISVSHAEPWANPSAIKKLIQWGWRKDAPLLFHPRLDWQLFRWGLSFLNNCRKKTTDRNIELIVQIAKESRTLLQQLRLDEKLYYFEKTLGILHFYTQEREFKDAHAPTELMNSFGCDRRIITPEEAISIEPALARIYRQLAGATYTPSDESGDAKIFTSLLSMRLKEKGVSFLYNTKVTALGKQGKKITHVEVVTPNGRYETLEADAYVVALGSYSPLLVRPLGIYLPIYPAKGYSITVPVNKPDCAYNVSLTDDEYKLVFSRLGNSLRIAGTAEFAGYDLSLNKTRCQAIVRRARRIFPEGGRWEEAQFWTGLRPATPSNLPIVGRSQRYDKLFFNTGHGTLGWTMACGTAKMLALDVQV